MFLASRLSAASSRGFVRRRRYAQRRICSAHQSGDIRYVHRRHVIHSQRLYQFARVALVGFDPIAWLARDQRGRTHRAVEAFGRAILGCCPPVSAASSNFDLLVLYGLHAHWALLVRMVTHSLGKEGECFGGAEPMSERMSRPSEGREARSDGRG